MHILFVDDKQEVLEGLQNRLWKMRGEWTMKFINNGEEALEIMRKQPFDVIVSDMRMPGMDGFTLMQRVAENFPQTARIVLTGQTERESYRKVLTITHQVINKPCSLDEIKGAVERATKLRTMLKNEHIIQAVNNIEQLPATPHLYKEVYELIEGEGYTLEALSNSLKKDPALTTRLLQIVNSSFYGLERKIGSVQDAISYVGVDILPCIILSLELCSASEINKSCDTGFSIMEFQKHSFRVAQIVEHILDDPESSQLAFSAAILHDVGELIMANFLPQYYIAAKDLAQKEHLSPIDAEYKVFGFSHDELGAHLLSYWQLPTPIVQAVAHHHSNIHFESRIFDTSAAIYIAEAIESGCNLNDIICAFGKEYLEQLNVYQKIASLESLFKNKTL